MSRKHDKARAEFWEVIEAKCIDPTPADGLKPPGNPQWNISKLTAAVDYMLGRLPTWAVEKATGWMKDWEP